MKEINNSNQNIKTTKYKFKKQICILFFLWLFLLISFFRVPIIGVIIDAIFFEFFFGYAKYLIYLILMLSLCLWFKKQIFYFMFSKRKIIFYSLLILFFCFLFSTINLYINQLDKLNFSEFYLNNKYAFLNNWYNTNLKNITDIKSYLMFNKFAWGGLIGTLFISILNKYSFIVILIILLAVLIILSFLVFNHKFAKKTKNKIINKLGGFNSNQIKIDTHQKINNENNDLLKTKLLILENINLNSDQININDDQIEVKLNNINEIKSIISIINNLKIENVKIIIDNNDFIFN